MEPVEFVSISLDKLLEGLELEVYPEGNNFLRELSEEEAYEFGEAPVQLLEGKSYEYKFTNSEYRLITDRSNLITQSKSSGGAGGRIVPNIYVGTLIAYAFHKDLPEKKFPVGFEVLSSKFDNEQDKSYRENYRFMLESITEKSTELLMQINSPVHQNYEVNFNQDNRTIYQRFCFVRSIINAPEFEEALQKIFSNSKTTWSRTAENVDTRGIKRFNQSAIKQLVSGSNRTILPIDHNLRFYGLESIPAKIKGIRKVESLDNPENRFIKHAMEVYLTFCEQCRDVFVVGTREKKEAEALAKTLENYLNHNFFKEISRPTTLKLNSPVLQRKSGYREILNSWMKYDLAAKLIWKGGDDVYKAGKRDIATLYEYWLFFTLYDMVKEKFNLNKLSVNDKPYDHLFEMDKAGVNLLVKAGKHVALEGECNFESKSFNIKFSYNRSYKGGSKYSTDKGNQGRSWTATLRPDYSLTFWPTGLSEQEAEESELIVHIHFDAKYKVTQFLVEVEKSETDLDEEKHEERKGNYKNADLLKMHAYKDAIRRTGGAYVLYPGTSQKDPFRGFHEIIPGLGAFAINPSKENTGISELSDFVDKVVKHLLDRSSQRDRLSQKVYDIHQFEKDDDNVMHDPVPEYHNGKGSERIIPDETFVLMGYCRSAERMDWYKEKQLYNFRMDDDAGSLVLDKDTTGAKYLVLREKGKSIADTIFKITGKGPKVYSYEKLIDMGYPKHGKGKDYYLVVKIEQIPISDFGAKGWTFKDLDAYRNLIQDEKNPYKGPGIPFTITLKELMRTANRSI